jgi:deoxyribonuclease-4
LGSGKDRHEHIGKGAIGTEGLRLVLNLPLFSGVPLILETPKITEDDDLQNLARVRELQEMQPAHKH